MTFRTGARQPLEQWAARDSNNDLYLYDRSPNEIRREENGEIAVGFYPANRRRFLELPPELLPDLAPGSKCRVKIVRDESINQ